MSTQQEYCSLSLTEKKEKFSRDFKVAGGPYYHFESIVPCFGDYLEQVCLAEIEIYGESGTVSPKFSWLFTFSSAVSEGWFTNTDVCWGLDRLLTAYKEGNSDKNRLSIVAILSTQPRWLEFLEENSHSQHAIII